jgi:hypothetical protein
VQKHVDHKEFVDMNSQLKELRLDKKNLVINACVKGRHRSVANKELQRTVVARLYNGEGSSVEMIDLQSESHWQYLCGKKCDDCSMKSKEFRAAENKAYDLLKHYIPQRQLPPNSKACPTEKSGVAASASAAPASTPVAASASAAPASTPVAASASAAPEEDSLLKICEDLVAMNSEGAVIQVIQQVLVVFRPGQSFFKTLQTFGTPAKVIEDLSTKEDLHINTIIKMFDEIQRDKGAEGAKRRKKEQDGIALEEVWVGRENISHAPSQQPESGIGVAAITPLVVASQML